MDLRVFIIFNFVNIFVGSTLGFDVFQRGCFRTEDKCPNENITFWLYTREMQFNPVQLETAKIDPKMFQPKRRLMVLIHGYTGHKDFSPNSEIRPAILEAEDIYVISLDYNPIARLPCYIEASYNIKTVARCTAELLDVLVEKNIFTFDDIHVVGFSLGGQTAGMISTFLQSGRLKRITGLDPAKPLFIFAKEENKLDESDAEFVDVIHTDVGERGMLLKLGHLDFYPNGGLDQPGCKAQNDSTPGSCNHSRAPEYFAESISSKIGFWGYGCSNWFQFMLGFCRWTQSNNTALMGYHASHSARGVYFLDTNNEPPYAKGPYPEAGNKIITMPDGSFIENDLLYDYMGQCPRYPDEEDQKETCKNL